MECRGRASPGDPIAILEASDLLAKGCNELIEWEREIKYTLFPEEFEDIQQAMLGWSNVFIDEMDRIPKEMAKIFDQGTPKGAYTIKLVFELPETFEQITDDALQRLKRYLSQGNITR